MTIQDLVSSTASAAGLDPNLALAVAQQESGFNQNALSSAGAIGVMQLMPATAAGLGVDPTDVTQNIQGGVTYLKSLLSEFGGDTSKALAAYNWGPGNVSAAVATSGADWLSLAPSETKNYVSSILSSLGSSTGLMISVPLIAGVLIAAWLIL